MIIAVDFDGTCVTHDFPAIGKDIGAIPVLKELIKEGHKLILYTMRSDNVGAGNDYLTQAVKWCTDNGISLYAANCSPGQESWTRSPKVYANLYIDDAAIGAPLIGDAKMSDRPYVNWDELRKILISRNVLTKK